MFERQCLDFARDDDGYAEAQYFIKSTILPLEPKYRYPNENCINPAYENVASIQYLLCPLEKRIWALRSDFILATGIKNAYHEEYGYRGLKDSLNESLHSFLDWEDRYGHLSLTISEGNYDGKAYYAGYICQRTGYLQVYLASGRFDRRDLNEVQTSVLEAYIAAQFQTAFGKQPIIFDEGDSNISSYHATFFSDKLFAKNNPRRCYEHSSIRHILQNNSKNLTQTQGDLTVLATWQGSQ